MSERERESNGNGGVWGVVFKITSLLVSAMLAWGVWVTGSIYGSKTDTERTHNAMRMETAQLIEHQMEKINDRLMSLDRGQVEIRMDLVRHMLQHPVYPNPYNTNRYTIP